MLTIPCTKKIDVMSKKNPPAARCRDGETVIFQTMDCYDGAVSETGERDFAGRAEGKYMANPATGPLYVEGAMPGDGLCVEILDIRTRDWSAMGTSFSQFLFKNCPGPFEMRAFAHPDGKVHLRDKILPVEPMIGVIGVAPAGRGVATVTPGSHGGNMDCRRIVAGSRIVFPVAVEGALLAMGDLHTLMGDGEVFEYGLETAGEVTVRVSVVKGGAPLQPTLYEGGRVMVIASARTYEDAARLAVEAMYAMLQARGWDPVEAGMLMSLRCDLAICQTVNPQITIRAMLDEDLL